MHCILYSHQSCKFRQTHQLNKIVFCYSIVVIDFMRAAFTSSKILLRTPIFLDLFHDVAPSWLVFELAESVGKKIIFLKLEK